MIMMEDTSEVDVMNGKMYGDNFNTRFKDNIADIFECGDCDKGANMTAEITEVELYKRYPDDYALPQVFSINSYVSQLRKNKRTQAII